MKKNMLIGLLSVTTVLSLAFGYYQKIRADTNEIHAIENEKIAREMSVEAERHRQLADEQRKIAEMNAMEARKQEQAAVEALNLAKKSN